MKEAIEQLKQVRRDLYLITLPKECNLQYLKADDAIANLITHIQELATKTK